jgi:hypothetical protein
VTSELTTRLRRTIEQWADDLRRSSELLQLTKRGKLPSRALALYLESLRYLFRSSQDNLHHAAAIARRDGHTALAAHFDRKAWEEQGHDTWASRDLAHLPPPVAQDVRPAREIVALVELQRELIAQHPLCFAAYALWAEYFTVLLGEEWLDALSASGYARPQISAVARHVDADREHAATGFAELEQLWKGEPELETLVGAVERAGGVFAAFCDEVLREARSLT